MLYELDVINAVCSELEEKGYVIVKRKKEIRHNGKDIIAKKEGADLAIMLYIEAVGGTSSEPSSKKYGKPFDRSQIKVHISELLYATAETISMQKLDIYEYKTGIAIPDNSDHREFIGNIQPFLSSLGIAVFFVGNGVVTDVISGWEL